MGVEALGGQVGDVLAVQPPADVDEVQQVVQALFRVLGVLVAQVRTHQQVGGVRILVERQLAGVHRHVDLAHHVGAASELGQLVGALLTLGLHQRLVVLAEFTDVRVGDHGLVDHAGASRWWRVDGETDGVVDGWYAEL